MGSGSLVVQVTTPFLIKILLDSKVDGMGLPNTTSIFLCKLTCLFPFQGTDITIHHTPTSQFHILFFVFVFFFFTSSCCCCRCRCQCQCHVCRLIFSTKMLIPIFLIEAPFDNFLPSSFFI
jgi:hypothetical protein